MLNLAVLKHLDLQRRPMEFVGLGCQLSLNDVCKDAVNGPDLGCSKVGHILCDRQRLLADAAGLP